MHRLLHQCSLVQPCTKHLKQQVKHLSKREVVVKAKLQNGRSVEISTGKVYPMADAAAVVSIGDTSVVATAMTNPNDGSDPGFMPLTVDYHASAFNVHFRHRQENILTGRMVDRSVRPMFPKHFRQKTGVTCQLRDGDCNADIAAINAASAALAISELPWSGPVAAVRVGMCDGEWLLNPTSAERQHSSIDLTVTSGPKKSIVMLEGSASNVPDDKMQQAIKYGVKEASHIVRAIQELAKQLGKKKIVCPEPEITAEVMEAVLIHTEKPLVQILSNFSHHKQSRDDDLKSLRLQVLETVTSQFPDVCPKLLVTAYDRTFWSVFRNLILDTDVRCDGRSPGLLRDISCAVDIKRKAHGSAVFQRGQTVVTSTLTLGPVQPSHQSWDETEKDENFQLRYKFPGAATNEFDSGPAMSRREIGHGALADKALRPLVPSCHDMTVSLEAHVDSSNGSSSMATVCGGSLALYDAGVATLAPCAGVAMGLVTQSGPDGAVLRHTVLTDILGIEDYLGDMDLKIAGTRSGITALQCDVKLPGIPSHIITMAVQKSQAPRNKVLTIMDACIAAPRPENSRRPVTEGVEVPPSKRSRVLGPGGATLRKIRQKTGVAMHWASEGSLVLWAPDRTKYEEAKSMLDALLLDKEPVLDFGAVYTANILEVRDAGVMIELKEGMTPTLLHNSQLDMKKVYHPSVLGLKVGDSIKVKYFGRDENSGQLRISRKAVQMMGSVAMTVITPP